MIRDADTATHGESNEASIADAQVRLEELNRKIAEVEAERTAIAADIARRRRSTDPLRLTVDAGTRRATFGGDFGTRVDDAPPAAPTEPLRAAELPSPRDPADDNVDRGALAAIWDALADGATVVRIDAGPGGGATTLLAALAAEAPQRGFPDGAVQLTDVRGPTGDIGQRLIQTWRPGAAGRYFGPEEMRALLGDRQALVLLDRARLTAAEQAELVALAPRLRFVVVDSLTVDGTPGIRLGPLRSADARTFLEAGYGRAVDDDDLAAALEVCTSVTAWPGRARLIGIAAAIWERSLRDLHAEHGTGSAILKAFIATFPAEDQTVLTVLARARLPLSADAIGDITGENGLHEALIRLTARECVCYDGTAYEISRSLKMLVAAPADAHELDGEITAALARMLDPRSAQPLSDRQLSAAEALLHSHFERAEWARVTMLGPHLAARAALRSSFGAWGRILDLLAQAAERNDQPALHDSANHERGVRALLLGDGTEATLRLRAAERSRKRRGDYVASAASAAVLARVEREFPAPAPVRHARRPSTAARGSAVRRRRLRQPVPAIGFWTGAGALAVLVVGLIALVVARNAAAPAIASFTSDRTTVESGGTVRLCVAAANAAFLEIEPRVGLLPSDGTHCAREKPIVTTVYTATALGPRGHEARSTLTIVVLPAPARRLTIEAFGVRPARIAAGATARLCYAVSGATQLRIVPYVGPTVSQRACPTVSLREPHRYTYTLVAVGDGGQTASRRLHVDVLPAATRPPATPAPIAVVPSAPTPGAVAPSAPPASAQRPVAAVTAPRPVPTATPVDGRLARRAVYQFEADPATIVRGQTSSLCVGVGHWAHGDVTAIGSLTPGLTRCYRVHPQTTTAYRLHVTLDRSSAFETVTISVRPPATHHDVARNPHR